MKRSAIITDHTVAALYGKRISAYFQAPLFSFPSGEMCKTRATKEALEDQLLLAGYLRDTTIIGLGGGVVTDMAGFIAATFCRGVPLILIPTTLLAMVDAAIGGKNGVNTAHGKNMIGTIYHPEKVIIDPRFLKTLPEKELFNGRVEMIKHGLIADPGLIKTFDLHRAIEVKRRIVAQDDHETGIRSLLNLGHTLGHALEKLSDYTLSHGEAVAQGIVLESRISHALGILDSDSLALIEELFPLPALVFTPEKIAEALKSDKKRRGGLPHFVLLKKIGEPYLCGSEYCHPVPESILMKVLHDASLCRR